MILHIILASIFVIGVVSVVIIVINVIKSGRTITPRQAIKMFERLQEKGGAK